MKVQLFGYGKMGKIHGKYLDEQNIPFTVYDPKVKMGHADKFGDTVAEGITHAIIASPYDKHWENYQQVREWYGDIPILIEKPVFIDKEHLPEIKNVFAGMCERFNENVVALKEKIEANNEQVVCVHYTNVYENDCSNKHLDLEIHGLDLAASFKSTGYISSVHKTTCPGRTLRQVHVATKTAHNDRKDYCVYLLEKVPSTILLEQQAFFRGDTCDATKAHRELLERL